MTWWIHGLGTLTAVSFALQAVFSVFLAASQPGASPSRTRFFAALADPLDFLPEALLKALHGEGWLATGTAFLLCYHGPILVATASALGLLAILTIRRDRLAERHVRSARRWAYAFALIALPAFSVLQQDIWSSVAWGQAIHQGINPYSVPYPPDPDLPLDDDPHVTNYGPLWAAVFGLAAWVAGGSSLWSWLILKIVLVASWCACLWVISRLLRGRGTFHRITAIVVVGWLPMGVHAVVAEGHNDVVMMLLALLWVYQSRNQSKRAPLMLAGSVLIKYVTAPLFLVDFLDQWRGASMTLRAYAWRVLPAVGLLVACGLFLSAFSEGALSTASFINWQFLTPDDLLRVAGMLPGLSIPDYWPFVLLKLGYASFVALEAFRVLRAYSAEGAARLRLAIMVGIIFMGYVWPWYFIWCVPFAVLAPSYWLSWFMIGAAVVAPLTVAHWWKFDMEYDFLYSRGIPALVMYAAAFGALAVRSRLGSSSASVKEYGPG